MILYKGFKIRKLCEGVYTLSRGTTTIKCSANSIQDIIDDINDVITIVWRCVEGK